MVRLKKGPVLVICVLLWASCCVKHQCHLVARWIKGRIYQVKGPHTSLVHCRNHVKFVHVDPLKKTAYQSSSSEVEE